MFNILSFDEIGFDDREYFGDLANPQAIRGIIIDMAANTFLSYYGGGNPDYKIFSHYEWEIDYDKKCVIIPKSAII